jgi:hypothetical protein
VGHRPLPCSLRSLHPALQPPRLSMSEEANVRGSIKLADLIGVICHLPGGDTAQYYPTCPEARSKYANITMQGPISSEYIEPIVETEAHVLHYFH